MSAVFYITNSCEKKAKKARDMRSRASMLPGFNL